MLWQPFVVCFSCVIKRVPSCAYLQEAQYKSINERVPPCLQKRENRGEKTMNKELEKKLSGEGFIERLPMSPERRAQAEEMFKESMEAESVPYMDKEEANRTLDVLWRWFLGMRRDAVNYHGYLKWNCERINNSCNQVFDWRDGENGELLVERLERLRQFQYSIETATSLFDEIARESKIRGWVRNFPGHPDGEIEYLPPQARDFYRPILKTLQLASGFDKATTVLQFIRQTAGSQTDDVDFLRLATPHITTQEWRNIANRAARQMTQKGLLLQGSPRGEWTISPEGEKFLEGANEQSEDGSTEGHKVG
jgi:hypothetical protein